MKQRLLALDAIKGLAILMVVMGHIYIFADSDSFALPSYVENFIGGLQIPLFILVAGIFSQKKMTQWDEYKGYFKDKIIRLLIPVFLFFPLFTLWHDGRIHLSGIYTYQYWFTINLFLYFTIFVLQRASVEWLLERLKQKENRVIDVCLHLTFAVLVYYLSVDFLPQIYPPIENYFVVVRERIAWYYPYLVLGFLIGRFNLIDVFQKHGVAAIAFIFFCLGLCFIRGWQGLEGGMPSYVWNNMYRIIVPAFFILCIYVFSSWEKLGGKVFKVFVLMGQWSMPIYFIHYFFLPVFPGMRPFLASIVPDQRLSLELLIYFGGAVLTLVPTLAIIWCIKLNPYLDFFLFGEKHRLLKK